MLLPNPDIGTVSKMTSLYKQLTRKKIFLDQSGSGETLDRCLTTFDLTALGVGATLGVGIYVLAGEVAKDTAGPAVLLSFFIAGVASFFSALCYAELGARVPSCGSAYVYAYVTVGEFVAFVIGWNLLLEYVIGTASVARAYSGQLDSLVNNTMQKHFREAMPINISFLSEYPDFCALGITLLLTGILSVGVKESTRFNNIFTFLNLAIVLFVIIFGFFHADLHNWKIPEDDLPKNASFGTGGFFPYGATGVLSGAATCFYGYVGFDAIATSGEETLNPQRSIPVALVGSLMVIFLSYCGISTVVTLMVPYFKQDTVAPLSSAFQAVGVPAGRWVVAIGALFGLSTSLLGAMFPLPRVILAMASDGVIFRFLATIHPRTQTPVIATVIGGVITGLLAMLMDLKMLIDMMSIGTLMAYMMVGVCVIILHYKPSDDVTERDREGQDDPEEDEDDDKTILTETNPQSEAFLVEIFNLRRRTVPNKKTFQFSQRLVILFLVFVSVEAFLCSQYLEHWHQKMTTAVLVILALNTFLVFLIFLSLQSQPQNREKLSFSVPLVPSLPCLSVFINIYLMMKLSLQTWIRFFVWLAVGLAIYFSYGIRNSTERRREGDGNTDRRQGYGSTDSSSSASS